MMKALFAIVVGAAVVLLGLTMTASHWWKKCGDVVVTHNGRPGSNVNVYRSRDGSVLVHLKQGEGLYVIHPESREIGIPNRSSFFILPGYAYSKNVPPLTAPMGKAEVDPQLRIEGNYIEFNSINNDRVRVSWRDSK